jgi:putative tryptophan/tyrosine transport system substrate-binding protein
MWSAIQAVAPSLGVELRPIDVRNASDIERAVAAFARNPNGGMILTGSGLAVIHRDLIIALAADTSCPLCTTSAFFQFWRSDLLWA